MVSNKANTNCSNSETNELRVNLNKIECFIFDMDGVLYDSMKNHEKSWAHAFSNTNFDFSPRLAYLYEGKPGTETIKEIFEEKLGKTISPEECENIYQRKVKYMASLTTPPILPKMDTLIDLLKKAGKTIWVVTGSKQPSLLSRLKNDFGIEANNIISAKDVSFGKPNPEPYLKALSRSGYSADKCVVIENAPLGVRSSVGAGIYTIAVNTGILTKEDLENAGANIVLNNTDELFNLVADKLK